MRLLSRLESRLGLTRADVTIALIVAATAIAGLFITLLQGSSTTTRRGELLALSRYSDSLARIERDTPTAHLERQLAAKDSIPQFHPIDEREAALDDHAERVAAERSPSRKDSPSPVDINHASKDELMDLPGVGEKTADAIIALRTRTPFRRVDDLMNVKGIGEKKLAKMKPYVRLK
jgi:competence ComEA-like helix-hairpin-helix protein